MGIEELWRPVIGYEALREVSNLGRVRSPTRIDAFGQLLQGRLVSLVNDGQGYTCIGVYYKGKRHKLLVHDLVATAFLGPRPEGYWIHHLNENRADNRVVNLVYMIEAVHKSLSTRGEHSSNAKLVEEDVRTIRKLYATGVYSYSELGIKYGVDLSTIHLVVVRKTWRHIE